MTSKQDHQADESEPWLDSLLEEVLGGQRPPDLKDRILQQWNGPVGEPHASVDPIDVPTIQVQPRGSTPPVRRWTAWSITGITCLAALLMIAAAQRAFDRAPVSHPMVQSPPGATAARPAPPRQRQTPAANRHDSDKAAPEPHPLKADGSRPGSTSEIAPEANSDEPLRDESRDRSNAPTRLAKLDPHEVIAQINQQLRQGWERRSITPSPALGDADWCRRVFTQLVGREPNPTELRDFLRDTSADRKTRLVDHLLGDRHAQEFADHWSRHWSLWLLSGSLDTSKAIRTGLQGYLATALVSNQPYDKVCAQLIQATGTNDPSRDDFDGATNFMLALNEKASAVDAASQLCRVMIGQRADCARCHDDTSRRRSQREFWQLAATVGSVDITVLRPGRGLLRDVDDAHQAMLQFQDPTGHTQSVTPGDLEGQPLIASPDASLRRQLARQLVSSDDFSRAAVNRFWSVMLRYGFTLPVDDMGRHNPESNYKLVEMLSNQFMAHGCDLRQLIRWIALSDAFDRSEAITRSNMQDAPSDGGAPLFSRFYYRPVLFTETSQGLAQLAAGDAPRVTYAVDEEEREELNARRQRNLQSRPIGATEFDTLTDRTGQLLPSHYLSLIRSLAAAPLSPEQHLEHAFMVVHGRLPNEAERAQVEAIWQAADGVAVTALERIFWCLLNTQGS